MNKTFNISTKETEKRQITVFDNIDKKEVSLDISFIPAYVTIEFDEVRLKTAEINKLLLEQRSLLQKQVEDLDNEDYTNRLKELSDEINKTAPEIAETRLNLTLEVLKVNGNDVDEKWLESRLDYDTLHQLCMIAPDWYYQRDNDQKKTHPKEDNLT